MKIPVRLFQSRHGVYYYRIQFHLNSKRIERRFSLLTKCPRIAKAKALQISAIIANSKHGQIDMTFFDPDALANLLKNADQYKKFDVELPNGIAIRNINTPEDLAGAEKILKQLNATIPQNPVVSTPTPPAIQGGITLEEMTEKYATRKDGKNSDKTNYEYRNYHKHFSKWLAIRKDNKAFPLRLITESDISDYIDDLKANGKSDRTIQDKYLAALSSLFVLAQASGAYPKGDSNPARGHKVFSKNDLKKVGNKTEYKPFTNDELQKIFSPKSLLAMPRPADFWLPILALHTGGRIEELCQLAITDILKVDDIWAISINDDDYKSVKSDAARREVPIHPQLIQLGFLDYVEDAKKYGTMLFPYLVPDQFGKFSPTPSERFGKYLDTLEIIDKHKVFHSFRKTANNHLKQKGVPEEMRCQYVGHERESLNSNTYAEKFSVSFLAENVSKHLIFDAVDFSQLTYQKGRFSEELARLSKTKRHREIIQERKAAVKKAQEKTSVASSPTTKSKAT